MNKIAELYRKHREIVNYLIFGVLTTVISFAVYFALLKLGGAAGIVLDDTKDGYSAGAAYALRLVAQVLQWVAGVLFAFFTNRKWVFDGEGERMLPQLLQFSASRLATLGLDTVVTLGMVALLGAIGFTGIPVPVIGTADADVIAKCVAAVLVVIANYVISKFFVFRKKK